MHVVLHAGMHAFKYSSIQIYKYTCMQDMAKIYFRLWQSIPIIFKVTQNDGKIWPSYALCTAQLRPDLPKLFKVMPGMGKLCKTMAN